MYFSAHARVAARIEQEVLAIVEYLVMSSFRKYMHVSKYGEVYESYLVILEINPTPGIKGHQSTRTELSSPSCRHSCRDQLLSPLAPNNAFSFADNFFPEMDCSPF